MVLSERMVCNTVVAISSMDLLVVKTHGIDWRRIIAVASLIS
jgi:hypothetical protein